MKWFRFYHEFLDDPKVLRLSEKTQLFFVKILCVSSKENDRGMLPDLKTISILTRTTKAKASKFVDELRSAGFIDEDVATQRLRVHGWETRQYESDGSADRMKRFRDGKCDVTKTVTTSSPRRPQNTDSRRQNTEKNEKESPTPYFGSVSNTAELEEPFETGEPEAPPAIKLEPQKPLDPELVKLIEIAEDLFPMAEFGREVQRAAKTSRLKLIEEALKITHQAGKNYWPYTRKVIQTLEQNGWKDPVDAYGYAPKVGEKILPSRTVKVEYYQDPWLSPAPQGATV